MGNRKAPNPPPPVEYKPPAPPSPPYRYSKKKKGGLRVKKRAPTSDPYDVSGRARVAHAGRHYSKRVTDPQGVNVWENIRELSKQPPNIISRNLTDAEREFIHRVVFANTKRFNRHNQYDRIRDELIKIIERLSGERFRDE